MTKASTPVKNDHTGARPVRLKPADVLRLGLLGLFTRKMRATLSALGISIGIATMVIVTGIPASSNSALQAKLTALGTNILQAKTVPLNNEPVPLPEHASDVVQRIGPAVRDVAQVGNTHSTVQRSDRIDPSVGSGITVLATSLDLVKVLNSDVASGRFLNAASQNFPTVVLGRVAAGWLGIGRIVPGGQQPQIYVGHHWFTVAGILGPMPLAPDIERSVLVGWGAAKAQLGFDGHPESLYVKVDERAIDDVADVLPRTVYPQAPGQVTVSRPSDALAAKQAAESNFSALFLGLAGVALLVGGVGVANTMFISVLERRREIGLRRALGANRGQIRGQFLTEAVVLSGLGGVAGTVLGLLATAGYATYQSWPVTVPVAALFAGVGGAVVVGVLAGLQPSIRAARLTPTQALATT